MQAVAGGRDTLAVLPSGAGKSAVYTIAGLLVDGPVLIVSPLIALQRDQVQRLEELGEDAVGRAAVLNSSLSALEHQSVLDGMRDGTVRFVSENIDLATYRGQATISGGEATAVD